MTSPTPAPSQPTPKTQDRDSMGWPIRNLKGVRVCARPGCRCGAQYRPSAEFRIDGYCSCECRDTHVLEEDYAQLLAERDALRAALTEIASGGCEGSQDEMCSNEPDLEREEWCDRCLAQDGLNRAALSGPEGSESDGR